jgi:hypothetical protein
MELVCSAGISKISIKAKEKHGIVVRIVRMTLTREFDYFLARAVGGDAVTLLDSLEGGAASKIEIPIDGVRGDMRLKGEKGDDVTITNVMGVKVTGKSANSGDEDEGERATAEMVFDFPFTVEAWKWFGQNVAGRAHVTFTKAQLELGLGVTDGKSSPPAAKNPLDRAVDADGKKPHPLIAAAAAQASGTLTQEHVDAVREYVESRRSGDTEEQGAETPEDAERLRDERLAREHEERFAAQVDEILGKAEVREDDSSTSSETDFVVELSYRGMTFSFTGESEQVARAVARNALLTMLAEEADRDPARAAEIEKLTAEQAEDDRKTKKALLKVPTGSKKKREPKAKGEARPAPATPAPETPAPETPAVDPTDLCFDDCTISHQHTEKRIAF